jgi:uncharacterized membrane protein YqaE (UPF0057 family)
MVFLPLNNINLMEKPARYWVFGLLLAVIFPPCAFFFVNSNLGKPKEEIENYRWYFTMHWVMTLMGWTPGIAVAIYYLSRNSSYIMQLNQMDFEEEEQLKSYLLVPSRNEEDVANC